MAKIEGYHLQQTGDEVQEILNTPVKTIQQTLTEGQKAQARVNIGAYSKPSEGIPASDLAPGVIPDVSQFITKNVNDLTNYYLKSETYTKDEVAALIGAIQQFHYEIVATLPATGEGNVLYLVGPTGSGSDRYEEYVYANNQFTKIGDTSIDLSGYVTTTALNTALAAYTTSADLATLLAAKQDVIADLTDIRSGAEAGATAYQKPSTGIPASDLASGVIPDVSQFITRSVNDLVNYYKKTETYTKTDVDNLIGSIQSFHYEIAASTSAVTNPQSNVLYLIGPTGSGSDKYEEYVYSNGWVKIGDTSIDLSGYVTTTALNTALAAYTTSADLATLLAGKQDTISDLETIRSGAAAGATAYQKPTNGIPNSDLEGKFAGSPSAGGAAFKAMGIPFGEVDSTSTATEITATVDNFPTTLTDGVCAYIRNDVIASASGWTLNINGTGAKPVYQSLADASRVTTLFSAASTHLFIYNSSRVEGGCWDLFYGYNSNDNTIGYILRTNYMSMPVTSACYRYRLLFTSANGQSLVPANASTSTNATAKRNTTQTPIDPFGSIRYYNYTSAVSSGARPGVTYLAEQYQVTLGYSFNRTGAALTLTSWDPVYIKCAPQSDGSAIIDEETPYVQALPSTEDGKIYIFLGVATSETQVEVVFHHPVYYYKDGAIRLWTNAAAASVTVDQTYDGTSTNAQSGVAMAGALAGKQDTISDLADIRSGAAAGATAYQKPQGGIPASDIAENVIPDVSQFITKTVNDLANYYLKTDTYTKDEVQQLISTIHGFSYEVVATLPAASADTMGKIYLAPSADPQSQNIKDEYITIDNGASAQTRYTWEQIGSTAVDLSGYVTTSDLNTALAAYTTSADLATLLAGKQDTIDASHKLDYSLLSNTPTIPAAQVNSDWNASSGVAQILNKPDLSNVLQRKLTVSDITALTSSQCDSLSEGDVVVAPDSQFGKNMVYVVSRPYTSNNALYLTASDNQIIITVLYYNNSFSWEHYSFLTKYYKTLHVDSMLGDWPTYPGTYTKTSSDKWDKLPEFLDTSCKYEYIALNGNYGESLYPISAYGVDVSYLNDQEKTTPYFRVSYNAERTLEYRFTLTYDNNTNKYTFTSDDRLYVSEYTPYTYNILVNLSSLTVYSSYDEIYNACYESRPLRLSGDSYSAPLASSYNDYSNSLLYLTFILPDGNNSGNEYHWSKIVITLNNSNQTVSISGEKAINTTQPQGGFLPNVEYNLGTLTGNVTFALASAVSGIPNKWYWCFTAGSTAPTINWPTGLLWPQPDAKPPTIEANDEVEVEVKNGHIVALVFKPTS